MTSTYSNPLVEGPASEIEATLMWFYEKEVEQRSMTVDKAKAEKYVKQAADFLTGQIRKRWLFLSGGVGTGKTTLLRAIRDLLIHYDVPNKMFAASGFPNLFLNNEELTGDCILRGSWCNVLLLDDVGVEQVEIKEYGNIIQPFIKIVEERYNRLLPMIVSTNLSGREMADRYGERTIDRIKEMSVAIQYNGKSFRV